MAGGDKNKGIANAPKKKRKKASMISKRPTGIHIRSDPTPSLPSRGSPIRRDSRLSESYSQLPHQIHPPSSNMDPPLAYTQQPPRVPMMMRPSGYGTPHGYSQSPLEAQRPTSSASQTVIHQPVDSQPSSVSTPRFGISSLRLRGNNSEPDIPITGQLATHGQLHPQVGTRDTRNKLVIEPDGYSFNPDGAVRILSQIIRDLYRGAAKSWRTMDADLKRQIFFEFRRKCCWRPEHEAQISRNFKKKAARILVGLLSKARTKNKRPKWILPENWQKLVDHWETDVRFKQMSEIGKKARASTKGGSLHTSGAQSQGNVRRKLEKELGRPITQAEAFKATHTRKKKNSGDPDVWVEPRAQLTYNRYLQSIEDFRQTQPNDSRGMPLSQEQTERMWLDVIGGPSRYGYAYGLPQRAFREFYSELEGLGSSQDDGSRETILALEKKIVELSTQAKVSQARERQRDREYAGMKDQLDALLASGGIPPCPGDAVRPPRPPQSQPILHGTYGQYRGATEESSSDDEEEEYVANTPPRY